MNVMAIMSVRILNLVVPLASPATDMRIRDTTGLPARSRAVSQLIGKDLEQGDVDSTTPRSTTPTTPGIRASMMATATSTTRTTRSACARSADTPAAGHADFLFEDLVQAYIDCRQSKRNSASALAFEIDMGSKLLDLYERLQDGSYQPGRHKCFVITRPKPREVWAAPFEDRIVHHLAYNKVSPRFHASFIADSCACIPGRGTLYGAQRLEAKIRSITQNWSRPAWYLKCDLANFFVSIDKRVVREILREKISEPWWRAIVGQILFHDPRQSYDFHGERHHLELVPPHKRLLNQPTHKGLPIGNLSSQFFANVLLDKLDQRVKHQLRARHYIRYVDDFILLHESPQQLNAWLDDINQFLPTLGLQLNPKKTILQPIDRGVDFVGQVIYPHRRTIRRRSLRNAIQRISTSPGDRLFETINSYYGLLTQASHSHNDRVRLSHAVLARGHAVSGDLTKTFRRSA